MLRCIFDFLFLLMLFVFGCCFGSTPLVVASYADKRQNGSPFTLFPRGGLANFTARSLRALFNFGEADRSPPPLSSTIFKTVPQKRMYQLMFLIL